MQVWIVTRSWRITADSPVEALAATALSDHRWESVTPVTHCRHACSPADMEHDVCIICGEKVQ